MSDNRINFTKRALELLSTPDDGRVTYHDSKTPGLILTITPSDTRTFYLYRRIDGRPARLSLGRFPTMTVEQARRRVAELQGDIARGVNPQVKRQLSRGEMSFGDLFDHYLEHYAKAHKRTWREDEKQFKRYLDSWRGRKLSAIKRGDVVAIHAKIAKSGIYAANRALALIRKLFNYAADELGVNISNPASRIKKYPEQKRERFLDGDELKRLFAALENEPSELIRDFVIVALFTGARRGNVQSMRWDELDFNRRVWVIPNDKAKAGATIHVPLVDTVIEVVSRRRESANGSPWVFASRSKVGHLTEPQKAWNAIVERAGLKNCRMHDLRHTIASWAASGGTSLHVLGKALGHRRSETTARYAHLQDDPVREALVSATGAMLAAVAGEGGDNGK